MQMAVNHMALQPKGECSDETACTSEKVVLLILSIGGSNIFFCWQVYESFHNHPFETT